MRLDANYARVKVWQLGKVQQSVPGHLSREKVTIGAKHLGRRDTVSHGRVSQHVMLNDQKHRLLTTSSPPGSDPELLTSHLDPLDTIGHLLLRHLPSIVWISVLGLAVNAEGAESTIIRGSQLIDGDILRSADEGITDLLWRLHARVERIHHTDEGDLFGRCQQRITKLLGPRRY